MIILDMNQISLASLMMHLNMEKTEKPDEGMEEEKVENTKGIMSKPKKEDEK